MTLSVILCTFNPRQEYLGRTLDALRTQSSNAGDWEFILVDNNSPAPVTSWADLRGLPHARVLTETEQGFTPALLRGLREAKGDICLLVHDDNVLAPDYVATGLRLGQDMPRLGAWGGQFTAEYEENPARELAPFLTYLAVNPLARDRWSNKLYDYEAAPAGAGMFVRAPILREWAGQTQRDPRRRALGRRRGEISSCEDFDIAFTAIDLGFGVGVFRALNVIHLIPAQRVQREYLVRLVEGHACSTVLLHAIRDAIPVRKDGALAALRRWRYRRSLPPIQRELHDALQRGERAGFARLHAVMRSNPSEPPASTAA